MSKSKAGETKRVSTARYSCPCLGIILSKPFTVSRNLSVQGPSKLSGNNDYFDLMLFLTTFPLHFSVLTSPLSFLLCRVGISISHYHYLHHYLGFNV